MTKPAPIRRPRRSEQGFGLIAVIFLVALLTIWLAIALPKISKQIQRDREVETMHRGKQYIRAVRLYYKTFGAYPTSIDVLAKPTNGIRFLRRKYTDPITGKDDWKPILVGQNKAPLGMGFFGQPIGAPAGCGGGANPLATNSFSGSSPTGGGMSTSYTGNTSGFAAGGASAGGTSTGSTSDCLGTGLASTMGSSTPTPGTPSPDQNTTGSTSGTAGGSTTGLSGQTFGGGPMMGFAPNSPKKSILIYKTEDHYNLWEFVYSPLVEQMMAQGGMGGGGNGLNGTQDSGAGPGSGRDQNFFGPPADGTGTGAIAPPPSSTSQ